MRIIRDALIIIGLIASFFPFFAKGLFSNINVLYTYFSFSFFFIVISNFLDRGDR